MPKPDRETMFYESLAGTGIVLGITAGCVLVTHAGALGFGTLHDGWWWFFFLAIYLEATVAVCCLLGILFGDPGTIKRSPETCLTNPVVEPQGRADPRSLCGARRRA